MQRIEKNRGYDLETVLDSMFCYKLPKRAPDSEPPACFVAQHRCKGTTLFRNSQILFTNYNSRNVIQVFKRFYSQITKSRGKTIFFASPRSPLTK